MAKLLSAGVESLPMSARIAVLLGALIGIALPVLEKLFPRARPFMPSAMGLGLGWIVVFSNTLSFAIGAMLVWVWHKLHARSEAVLSVPIASGLIAGEVRVHSGGVDIPAYRAAPESGGPHPVVIVAHAIFAGWDNAVREMKAIMVAARLGASA